MSRFTVKRRTLFSLYLLRSLKFKERLSVKKSRNTFRQHYAHQWEARFQELLQFFYENGHTRVTSSNGGASLSNWVATQRTLKRKGLLREDRERKLNGVEFVWYCGGQRFCWEELYQQLKWYHEYHGDCSVNYELYRERDPEYGYLAMWVHCLRMQHRRGSLGAGKILALEELDFNWGQKGSHQVPWDEMYLQACRYKNEHGHLNVRQNQDLRLFHWLANQRSAYRGTLKSRLLTEERIALLEAIGMQWRHRLTFDEGLQELAVFREQHGHGLVPAVYPEQPLLALFARSMRLGYKRHRLASWQIDALEDLGLPLVSKKPTWSDGLRRFERYARTTGKSQVDQSYSKDGALLLWDKYVGQRLNRLSKQQASALRSVGYSSSV